MALADRIAVMSGGRILQIGDARDLYHFPLNQKVGEFLGSMHLVRRHAFSLNRKVGEFLGSMNEFEGTLQSDGCVNTDLGVDLHNPNGTAKEVIVAIRPEDVALLHDPSGLSNEFPAQLVSQLFLGISRFIICRSTEKNFVARPPESIGKWNQAALCTCGFPRRK